MNSEIKELENVLKEIWHRRVLKSLFPAITKGFKKISFSNHESQIIWLFVRKNSQYTSGSRLPQSYELSESRFEDVNLNSICLSKNILALPKKVRFILNSIEILSPPNLRQAAKTHYPDGNRGGSIILSLNTLLPKKILLAEIEKIITDTAPKPSLRKIQEYQYLGNIEYVIKLLIILYLIPKSEKLSVQTSLLAEYYKAITGRRQTFQDNQIYNFRKSADTIIRNSPACFVTHGFKTQQRVMKNRIERLKGGG